MRHFTFAFLFSLICFIGSAQTPKRCATDEVLNAWLDSHPDIKADFLKRRQESKTADSIAFLGGYSNLKTATPTVYTVPIVFHIIHQYGSENVSDAQIIDAVSILNRDYRKLNADTANIVSPFVAADIYFEFRLATKDPNGKCTNGITRHADVRTNWQGNQSDYGFTWTPSKYLNVYLVKTMGNGSAGYTYLPGSVPANMDAIVILHNYVGSIGTSNPFTSRALTHEVGHWFNLPHVWGFNNSPGSVCGDEGVSDTPITKGWPYCPTVNASKVCTAGVVENFQNYMDYSYCSNMFTPGQAARMNTCINGTIGGRNNLWTNANLIATGVINPLSNCAPKADFYSAPLVGCVNTPVNFTDYSYNGTPTSWSWQFTGGTPATSTLQNSSASFATSGTKTVSLRSSNSTGADSVTKTIVTIFPAPGTATVNVVESFESITFPNNLWIASIPRYAGGWLQSNTAGATGSKSVYIDNYFDSPGEAVWFYTPMVDSLMQASLSFKVAYSQKASNSADRLKVYSSNNCGSTWMPRYNKAGATLHTTGSGNYIATNYTMPAANEWRTETVTMAGLNNAKNVIFKFEFTPDSFNPGNNIFIDDINIISTAAPTNTAGIKMFDGHVDHYIYVTPNPVSGKAQINFSSFDAEHVTIDLFDYTGKNVKRILDQNVASYSAYNYLYDMGDLTKGIYFMRFKLGQAIYTKKIIIE